MTDVNTETEINAGGGNNEGADQKAWLTSVPEKFRGHEVFKSIEKPEGVYERLIDLTEKSKGAVRIPDEKSTPEDIKTFREGLGVPESIEGYEIQKPDNLPEGMIYDDTLSEKMLQILHKSNAPKSLVQALFKEFNDYHINLHGEFNKFLQEGNEKRVQVLRDLWKQDYDKNNKETFLAISKFAEKANIPKGLYKDLQGVEALQIWIKDNGLDTDPMYNYTWSKVFELIGDDTFVKGSPSGSGTPDLLDEIFPSMAKK